jgi:hypothetical protein
MVLHLLSKYTLLYLISMLKQLLYHIVPKDISHQLKSIWLNLTEELLLLVAVGGFELLLNKSRSMLITTELDNVIVDIFQLISLVRFRVGAELFEQHTANTDANILILWTSRYWLRWCIWRHRHRISVWNAGLSEIRWRVFVWLGWVLTLKWTTIIRWRLLRIHALVSSFHVNRSLGDAGPSRCGSSMKLINWRGS